MYRLLTRWGLPVKSKVPSRFQVVIGRRTCERHQQDGRTACHFSDVYPLASIASQSVAVWVAGRLWQVWIAGTGLCLESSAAAYGKEDYCMSQAHDLASELWCATLYPDLLASAPVPFPWLTLRGR